MDRLKKKKLTAIKNSSYWGSLWYGDDVLDNKKFVSVFIK